MIAEGRPEGLELFVNSAECEGLQKVATFLPENLRESKIVKAVVDHIKKLYELRSIHGIAYYASNFPNCPSTLAMDVMMGVSGEWDDKVHSDFRHLTELDEELARRLPIPTGLSFVNASSREDVELLSPFRGKRKKPDLDADPFLDSIKSETLIAFVIFDRNTQ